MKIFYTLLSIICIASLGFSQKKKAIVEKNGYTISVATKNLKDEKIILFLKYGTNKQMIITDSVEVKTDDEVIELKNDKKIVGSIYFLKIKSKTEEIKLAIDNNSKINLILDNSNIETILCTNHEINKAFLDYQKNEKNLTKTENKLVRDKIIAKYPLSIISLYFKVENKILEKTNLPTTVDKTKYSNTFFNFFDKNDKRNHLLPNIYKLLYSYITILPINNQNYTKSIDLVFKNINCTSKNYANYANWFISNLKYFELENLESSYLHLYKTYIDIPNCNLFSEAELYKIKNTYTAILNNPIKSKIPDFTMVDKDSTSYTLSKIYPEFDYTYIAFYSPTCHHCIETMPLVNATFESIKNKYPQKKIQLLAIINDSDETQWQKFISDSKISNWLNLKSTDPKKTYQSDFNAYANPTFFLIDKKGLVLLKSYNSKAIEELIKKN